MNLPSSLTKTFDPRLLDFLHKKTDHEGRITAPEGSTANNESTRTVIDDELQNTGNASQRRTLTSRVQSWWKNTPIVLKRHCAFIGPGIIASVGYTDPGNWVTDLAAGSQFGYALLFVVLLSGIFGIFLQILAVRMGVVTGEDLARNTRRLCLPEGPDGELKQGLRWKKSRIALLWFCYFISEGALIATELAELIGSAIALNLLFPSLPVWGGVLVTSADVFVILFIYRPNGNFRILEWVIGGLVLAVIACYIALLAKVKPNWGQVFYGFVPTSTLGESEALYASIGILGAVIMPHSLFLGSHFATIKRIPDLVMSSSSSIASNEGGDEEDQTVKRPNTSKTWRSRVKKLIAMIDPDIEVGDSPSKETALKKFSIRQMKIQIPHASWDIALSLIFFAITVNSFILIVAGAAFYYGSGTTTLSDLYDAFNLLKATLGKVYAVLFAIALLAAGQSASITVTLAGQLVSEGFIKWKTNPFVRRLVTRLITIVPSIAVSVAVGRNGLDQTLIASQVALSFALPVVLVPLILVTSLKSWMEVKEDVDTEAADGFTSTHFVDANPSASTSSCKATPSEEVPNTLKFAFSPTTVELDTPISEQVPQQTFLPSIEVQSHNFTSPRYIIALGIIVYLTILLADAYTLVTTIQG